MGEKRNYSYTQKPVTPVTKTTSIDVSYSKSCTICGKEKELDKYEVEYAKVFGTVAGIYICDDCKRAIEWAKEMALGDKEKDNETEEAIHELWNAKTIECMKCGYKLKADWYWCPLCGQFQINGGNAKLLQKD